MRKIEKIVITCNDEKKFEEIEYAYGKRVKNCIDMRDYDGAFLLAEDLVYYDNYFYLLQNHLQDKKMVFIKEEGEYEDYYYLDNRDKWADMYRSYYK